MSPPQVMCKMGAIVAAGILDAGGRNATIGLRSRSGYFRRTSVVGLALFTQYWCEGLARVAKSCGSRATVEEGLLGERTLCAQTACVARRCAVLRFAPASSLDAPELCMRTCACRVPCRYWYPLLYFVSLAFTPSATIALNADLKMPK